MKAIEVSVRFTICAKAGSINSAGRFANLATTIDAVSGFTPRTSMTRRCKAGLASPPTRAVTAGMIEASILRTPMRLAAIWPRASSLSDLSVSWASALVMAGFTALPSLPLMSHRATSGRVDPAVMSEARRDLSAVSIVGLQAGATSLRRAVLKASSATRLSASAGAGAADKAATNREARAASCLFAMRRARCGT